MQDIQLCAKANIEQKKEIQISDLALKQSMDTIKGLNDTVTQQQSQLSAWYRNPFVMVGLGVIAGIVVIKR